MLKLIMVCAVVLGIYVSANPVARSSYSPRKDGLSAKDHAQVMYHLKNSDPLALKVPGIEGHGDGEIISTFAILKKDLPESFRASFETAMPKLERYDLIALSREHVPTFRKIVLGKVSKHSSVPKNVDAEVFWAEILESSLSEIFSGRSGT